MAGGFSKRIGPRLASEDPEARTLPATGGKAADVELATELPEESFAVELAAPEAFRCRF